MLESGFVLFLLIPDVAVFSEVCLKSLKKINDWVNSALN
jgi:hypothetical protein